MLVAAPRAARPSLRRAIVTSRTMILGRDMSDK